MKRIALVGIVAMGVVAGAGCKGKGSEHADHAGHAAAGAAANAMVGMRAVARVAPAQSAATRPTLKAVMGTVTFTQYADGVEVVARIEGLTPNSTHGFHIHEKGDLSAADLTSTGPHWNPGNHPHGGPGSAMVHAGDLGNLKSNDKGVAELRIKTGDFKLADAVGRAVIIHANPDDLTSQPAGNAGPRVAGGVIIAQ